MSIFSKLLIIFIALAIVFIAGYFCARYYLNSNSTPEYFFEHPTIARIFGISPICPTACAPQGVCAKDGKNYCNQCAAFQHGAGYAYDGPCKPAGWNTYKNFGIEFQYPNSKAWGLPQESVYNAIPQINFSGSNASADPFSVTVSPYSGIANGPQTFDQVVKNATSAPSSGGNINYVVSDVVVNGIKGKEILHAYNSSGAGQISVFETIFPFNDKSYISFDGDSTFTAKDIFETLVSTFKIDNSTAIQKDSGNGNYIYSNSDMAFEYPDGFNSGYAQLNMQTILARPGNVKITKSGCYEAINGSGKASSEKIITVNNIKFCLTTGSDVGAGQLYNSYYYTALHGGYYYVLGYIVHTSNGCGAYMGTNNYQPCTDFQKNYNINVIKPIGQSIATFKFKN